MRDCGGSRCVESGVNEIGEFREWFKSAFGTETGCKGAFGFRAACGPYAEASSSTQLDECGCHAFIELLVRRSTWRSSVGHGLKDRLTTR